MPLGSYPFSERYGWLQDRYNLSWQVMAAGGQEIRQKITPTLMFVGDVCGRAEEAIRFYASVFRNAAVGDILRYGRGEEPDMEGTVKYAPSPSRAKSLPPWTAPSSTISPSTRPSP